MEDNRVINKGINNMKIYAMIPARHGSQRLKLKNLALLNEKPLISYAVNAAKDSMVFDKIIINSDSDIFNKIAKRYGVDFYKRPQHLGGSEIHSDSVVYDFMDKFTEADIVVWVNPIAPLQTGELIKSVVSYFISNKLDSLITTEEKFVHSVYNNTPVNYDLNEVFAKTQDLKALEIFTYTVMAWRSKKFLQSYNEKGFGFFSGKFRTYHVDNLSALIVKTANDLNLIEHIMNAGSDDKRAVQYDHILNID
jgi:CMP-N-acetylneuraminic acid synthetase